MKTNENAAQITNMAETKNEERMDKTMNEAGGVATNVHEKGENNMGADLQYVEKKDQNQTDLKKESIDEVPGLEYDEDPFMPFDDLDDPEDLDDENPFMPKDDYHPKKRMSLKTIHMRLNAIAEEYHLAEEARESLKDHFTCRYETCDIRKESEIPLNGCIIVSEDEDEGMEITEKLMRLECAAFGGGHNSIDVGRQLEMKAVPSETGDASWQKWRSKTKSEFYDSAAVCVHNIPERVWLNVDLPSSNDRKKNLEDISRQDVFCSTLGEAARDFRKCSIYLVVTQNVYADSLKQDAEAVECICRHHITVPAMGSNEICDIFLNNQLKNYKITDSFAKSMRQYFARAYRASELKRTQFFEKLKDEVLSRYYIVNSGTGELSAELVPLVPEGLPSAKQVFEKLDSMVGWDNIKEQLKDLYASMLGDVKRDPHHHMLFLGNPGTGKTTLARMITEMLFSMGIIKKNKFIEVTPGELVSEWKNSSGKKTEEKLKEAEGGVIFIDEAYGLSDCPGQENEGKKMAVNKLISAMETKGDRILVIFAGYDKEMEQFLDSNPGIKSRISHTFHFKDYTVPQLKEILLGFAEKDGFTLDDEAKKMLDDVIMARMCEEHFGNGRDMRNLWQEIYTKRNVALFQSGHPDEIKDAPRVITAKHIEAVMPEKDSLNIENMVGLKKLKEKIGVFMNVMSFAKKRAENGHPVIVANHHMVFTGNPGTGKTTVAKMMAQELYNRRVLLTNKCIVVGPSDLITNGNPEENIKKLFQKARGGILFIDEAYQIVYSGYASAIITQLLQEMEEHKDDTIIILAGYSDEMQRLFDLNPGLESRIGEFFEFEDYTPDELYGIFKIQMEKADYVLGEGVETVVKEVAEYFMDRPHFGNGRFMEKMVKEVVQKRAGRPFEDGDDNRIEPEDIPTVAELLNTIRDGSKMRDPKKMAEEQRRRTAIHEMGHALILLATDPDSVPESISIRNQSSSKGRVKLSEEHIYAVHTESWYKNEIATLLAGRNAERIFLGEHTDGCVSDYQRACVLAKRMIEDFAMGQLGKTKKMDIIRECDELANALILKHRVFIEKMVDRLLDEKHITGDDMRAAFSEYLQGSKDAPDTASYQD